MFIGEKKGGLREWKKNVFLMIGSDYRAFMSIEDIQLWLVTLGKK